MQTFKPINEILIELRFHLILEKIQNHKNKCTERHYQISLWNI